LGQIVISDEERERLVMLFNKEHATEPLVMPPRVMANLMISNTPAVAHKWLEDENLLDEQQRNK
jgi:hypothetical protein